MVLGGGGGEPPLPVPLSRNFVAYPQDTYNLDSRLSDILEDLRGLRGRTDSFWAVPSKVSETSKYFLYYLAIIINFCI